MQSSSFVRVNFLFQTCGIAHVTVTVYNDLSHPPSSYIGPKYAYREADGSNNNLTDPSMGKAGSTYARSVQQVNPLPRNDMPDAGLVFDTLLKREKVCIAHLASALS